MSDADRLSTGDTRRRFEQWVSNPQCGANTVSAVHNVRMADVATKIGLRPTFGASPFALGRGNQFERTLLAEDGARLIAELTDKGVLPEGRIGLIDLRIRPNGGTDPALVSLDDAIARSGEFLSLAGRAVGRAVDDLPAVVSALTVRIPRGVMLPEATLILDAVAIAPVTVDGVVRARLTIGEIKTYPDRGGETDRGQLAQARAQLGLYLHALEVLLARVPADRRPVLDESGFLVLTRPGSDFPHVRAGEQLRYQADRAARGMDQLEHVARSLPTGTADAIDAVLTAPTHYSEACLRFCDLAERCHRQALDEQNPAVLGDDMVQFIRGVGLERASALLDGDLPADERETDLTARLRAAEEPGWE